MQKLTAGWVWRKCGRLWRRLLDRDFIRRRPKKIWPFPGADIGAFAIAYNEYGAYCVPLLAAHRPATRYIMAGRVWENETLKVMRENIGDGDVVHAGASFGDFFPLLSKSVSLGAHIWTFEPNLLNYKAAMLTLQINEIDNVTLKRAGLGAEEKSGSLVVENSRGIALGGASYVSEDVSFEQETEEISIVVLDKIIPADRHIDLIQLDVEGYEEQALNGALNIINRCRPVLIVETRPSDEWIRANLRGLGYEFAGQVDENYIYKPSL